ncbi:hypothetical protein [Sphingobacterium bovistauri]|uniref:RsbT co-antagonist protein rsbRD N-terminal domain-containing protein n=1 Tax=Sphingobacterium bovistauri TaxID=2781959 RepID=A0ABS7Z6J1_9SPHI|nr:hypothetical protein [Sphingobacterium bovistauri]MCA5005172.1 hypothetical protein [Sphingobacterium bovistauri]
MGIRYEKDTILNWINEMGKFLRLLVGKWEGQLEDLKPETIPKGYKEFFKKDREELLSLSENEIIIFASSLEPEQIRPLAQLLMYDGLFNSDKEILQKAKVLFEYHMKSSGSFSFEDYGFLSQIDKALK